jgi:hypothetical protein
MSDTLRVALVAEGITDYEFLNAAIESMLEGKSFILKLLQPESSVAFTEGGNAGEYGGGWKGVYKWCLQVIERSGKLSDDPLFFTYDLLVLHLDADVAGEKPDSNTPALSGLLPCEKLCPPPNATTDALRRVMLSLLNETQIPPKTVLCTPSKSTEAWIMAIFFANDKEMKKKGWECHPKPENRLGQQPKAVRFCKSQRDYEDRKAEIQAGWTTIVQNLTEARRFQDDFLAALNLLSIALSSLNCSNDEN